MLSKVINKIQTLIKDLFSKQSDEVMIRKNQEINNRIIRIKECFDKIIDKKLLFENKIKEDEEKRDGMTLKMENAAKANQEDYLRELIINQINYDEEILNTHHQLAILTKYEQDLEYYMHWLKNRQRELNERFRSTKGKFNPESEVNLQEFKFREKYYRIKKNLVKNQFKGNYSNRSEDQYEKASSDN